MIRWIRTNKKKRRRRRRQILVHLKNKIQDAISKIYEYIIYSFYRKTVSNKLMNDDGDGFFQKKKMWNGNKQVNILDCQANDNIHSINVCVCVCFQFLVDLFLNV